MIIRKYYIFFTFFDATKSKSNSYKEDNTLCQAIFSDIYESSLRLIHVKK
jgi:hypothetical protein